MQNLFGKYCTFYPECKFDADKCKKVHPQSQTQLLEWFELKKKYRFCEYYPNCTNKRCKLPHPKSAQDVKDWLEWKQNQNKETAVSNDYDQEEEYYDEQNAYEREYLEEEEKIPDDFDLRKPRGYEKEEQNSFW